jgi:hypothetical protein
MPLTLYVKASDSITRLQRTALAQRVVEYLNPRLSNRRLLCFLDDEEWQILKDENGVANRGIYIPYPSPLSCYYAPQYIQDRLGADYGLLNDLIYLHGTTCASELGLTMTLAHELQHCIHHSEHVQLWAANTLLSQLPGSTLSAMRLRSCDIPIEREARIVSKRVAEYLFGAEVLRQYIDAKITEPVTEEDASDWECIREISTSTVYDLGHETALLFRALTAHRTELEQALDNLRCRSNDFKVVDLDMLLRGGTNAPPPLA